MPTSTLFNDVPALLFAPLAAPDAATYSRILADLYAESRRAFQPLARDLVLDIIIGHTIASHTADDPLPRARDTLRYLEECGWLRTENQPDFSIACVLTPHAFHLLQLINNDSPSLLELLVTIHDLLKAALLDIDNEHRLAEAARITDQLHSRLKELQHNVGAVSFPDTARLRAAVMDAASKLETRGHAPARYIREQFQSFDRVLNDIAARHARSDTARPVDHAAAAQLAAILTRLAAADKKTFAKHAESLVNLYHRPEPKPSREASNLQSPISTFAPDDIPLPEPSADEIDSARREIMRQFNRPVSRERVRRLAESILSGRPEARAADIVAKGSVDLPLLIQLRLHGDGSLGYRIEDLSWVEVNALGFRDFVLKNMSYVPVPVEAEMPKDTLATDESPSEDEPQMPLEDSTSE